MPRGLIQPVRAADAQPGSPFVPRLPHDSVRPGHKDPATVSVRYIVKRLGPICYTLVVVSLIVFGITQVLLADATVMMLSKNPTPEALAPFKRRWD